MSKCPPRRRQYRKRTRWQKYSSAGKQLVKDVVMLKNLINTEFKHYYLNGGPSTIDYSGTYIELNAVPIQTSSDSASDILRTGDSIKTTPDRSA